MATKSLITIANKSALITPTGFNNYDVCFNPYVGCEFGCSYCYVRFFVKDKQREWGEFVRVRESVEGKLPEILRKGFIRLPAGKTTSIDQDGNKIVKKLYKSPSISEMRLVIGTMTDPYQPQEKKHRITRKALEILLRDDLPHFEKVGIFTRSPLVLQDIDLIKHLPKARIHFTITPYPDEMTRVIEPYSPIVASRWKVIEKIKKAGIRTHVNVAPVLPKISEQYIDEFAKKLAELGVDEYFVDPMQAYKESYESFEQACKRLPGIKWNEIEEIMKNKQKYNEWKSNFQDKWNESRAKYESLAPNQLPIWSDHEHRVWVNMKNGLQMNKKNYGDN